MSRIFVATLLCSTCAMLRADFTYQETTKIGGALANLGGPFTRGLREPTASTHMVKGDRMVTLTKDRASVIDLGKETITEIDFGKKTYSVMTFAEMKQAMEDAMSRMQKGNDKADVKWDVSAKATGQTKTIQGLEAKQIITTMTMAATDKQSGQTGGMSTVMETWIAPSVPGYNEVRAFYRKMGEKMGYLFGSGMAQMSMMRPEAAKGLAEAGKELAKLDGMPVLRIVKAGGSAEGQPGAQSERPQQQQGSPVSIGRIAGGLGGFGRKKKDDQQPAASGDQPASGGGSYAIETTTELTSYSSTPVDTSKFEVPAGFKEVESPMKRRR